TLSVRSAILAFSAAPSTSELSTLSLHDALPIYDLFDRYSVSEGGRGDDAVLSGDCCSVFEQGLIVLRRFVRERLGARSGPARRRSEEHTSELQSLAYLVCRLLLEKKKIINNYSG